MWRTTIVGMTLVSASGCILFSDLDATPGGGGGADTSTGVDASSASTSTATGSGSGTSGTSTASSSGATSTSASSSASTGVGGGSSSSGIACEPADFAGELGGGGAGGDGAGGSGAGGSGVGGAGCQLGTEADCSACCGIENGCLEINADDWRCSPVAFGEPAYGVSGLGASEAFVFAVSTDPNPNPDVTYVARYPLDAGPDFPFDTSTSTCEQEGDCANRTLAGSSDVAFVGSPTKGLLVCRPDEACAPHPGQSSGNIEGLRRDATFLYFLPPGMSQPSLSRLDLITDQIDDLVADQTLSRGLSVVSRGDSVFFSGTSGQNNALVRHDLGSGDNNTSILNLDGNASGMASDGKSIFWRQGNTVVRLTRGCEPEVLITSGNQVPMETKRHVEVDAAFIYFDLGVSGNTQLFRCLKDSRGSVAITLDGPVPSTCDRLGPVTHISGNDDWVVYAFSNLLYRLKKVR